ncbi:uncharacterized protein A4U43_UnF10930 [Asparagus officinalis]|uniref:CCHC-type domain-containing protein n=1 Tax=Asparagus officinalis TaxID=4686 RepID=A0A1R3L5E0_ASPOF|nr:uncharacterized protein LOC109828183 [Asparagus officinalis]ONK54826.1 uncharacterized protein A4U43_UnF10930 [Asparagus officinalis]
MSNLSSSSIMVDPLSNPQPKENQFWPPNAELSLLTAVLEIAREPAESYDPRINLFDRIGKILNKSRTNQEVLGKISELKARYLKRCRGHIVNGKFLKRTPVFEISEKIWGDEVKKIKDNWEKDAQSKKEHDVGQGKKHKKGMLIVDKLKVVQNQKRKLCFKCGDPGHLARHCSKEIEKHLPNQQETMEISEDNSTLQLDTENKNEEQANPLTSPRYTCNQGVPGFFMTLPAII